MHTQTFDLKDGEHVTVTFNPDFSGMAAVRWGDVMTGQSVEIPAIVLSVGIADLADGLWELAEQAQKLKDQSADFTWKYTLEDWAELEREAQAQHVEDRQAYQAIVAQGLR